MPERVNSLGLQNLESRKGELKLTALEFWESMTCARIFPIWVFAGPAR